MYFKNHLFSLKKSTFLLKTCVCAIFVVPLHVFAGVRTYARTKLWLGEESNFYMADVCALCLDDTGSNHCGAKF